MLMIEYACGCTEPRRMILAPCHVHGCQSFAASDGTFETPADDDGDYTWEDQRAA